MKTGSAGLTAIVRRSRVSSELTNKVAVHGFSAPAPSDRRTL